MRNSKKHARNNAWGNKFSAKKLGQKDHQKKMKLSKPDKTAMNGKHHSRGPICYGCNDTTN